MHYLIGIAVLVGFIGYAFGESIARAFVAAFLAVGALCIVFVVFVAVLDMHRQSVVLEQRTVRMGPQ